MKKIFKVMAVAAGLAALVYAIKQKTSSPSQAIFTVHFVLPLEHQALKDIVQGFRETLSKSMPGKIHFKEHNAQGDANLQRSILQKLSQEKADLVVPIGTTTTQSTVKLIKQTPILSLAAMYTETDRAGHQLGGVLDEISINQLTSFVETIHNPSGTLVIIHSTDDRRVKDALEMESQLNKKRIRTKRMMIHTLSDLYTLSQNLSNQTSSVVILKDHLVVSGIAVLKKACNEKKILLITSDEGTVKSGAPIGFGVTEKNIGQEGAKMAIKVLSGTPIEKLPIQHLAQLKIFVRSEFLANNPSFHTVVKKTAQKKNHQLIIISNGEPK
ncbi:MAG: ABC transporter substrate-binding protein [Alphaproteobacteria bacterium]